ncbi:MAG: NTP transferase domain-containing protein [Aquabacterium sp.]
MGNVDKGLRLLAGRPMVAWVRDRLAPQVDRILVNANRNLDAYGAFGDRVIPDSITGFAWPTTRPWPARSSTGFRTWTR